MASTNKTTNYELSQFLGTDKPAWLSDYNLDMQKIDTQMKANADGVTAADGKADANTTNIGDLTYLSTTVKNNLVAAINEVDTNADIANTTAVGASEDASAADTKATNALTAATGIQNYLKMTQFTEPTVTRTSGTGVTVSSSSVKTAVNADGSLGRIYGKINLTFTGSGSNTITIGDTKLRPTDNITVNGFAMVYGKNAGSYYYANITDKSITIGTDGRITFTVASAAGDSAEVIFQTGLIFAQDFGDEPE